MDWAGVPWQGGAFFQGAPVISQPRRHSWSFSEEYAPHGGGGGWGGTIPNRRAQPSNEYAEIDEVKKLPNFGKQTLEREWSSGLFDCAQDCPTATTIAICPCSYCSISAELGESPLLPLCGPPAAFAAIRGRLRQKLSIRGSLCEDFCMSFLCLPCVACQMKREYEYMGAEPAFEKPHELKPQRWQQKHSCKEHHEPRHHDHHIPTQTQCNHHHHDHHHHPQQQQPPFHWLPPQRHFMPDMTGCHAASHHVTAAPIFFELPRDSRRNRDIFSTQRARIIELD